MDWDRKSERGGRTVQKFVFTRRRGQPGRDCKSSVPGSDRLSTRETPRERTTCQSCAYTHDTRGSSVGHTPGSILTWAEKPSHPPSLAGNTFDIPKHPSTVAGKKPCCRHQQPINQQVPALQGVTKIPPQ